MAGVAYAIPAALVALQDPAAGVPLAVGVLPAAILPIPERRRDRVRIFVTGSLVGLSLFLGGVISGLPTLVTAGLLATIVILAAVASVAAPNGSILLVLCAPLLAAGLSYDDLATSFQTFLLLVTGAAYSWLVSLAWPARAPLARTRPASETASRDAMARYGIRLGIAAGAAYVITASLGLDHPGWAPAACLLVARPELDLLRSRGIGRVVSVTVGALAAGIAVTADPPAVVYALLTIVVLGAAAASVGSRWYITSGFTTFFVFLMLLSPDPGQLTQKFNERVAETILGVGLAYLSCWLWPALAERMPRSKDATPAEEPSGR